jgi:hypothetical protein
MAEPFKITVKLPGGEFSAEGAEESVTAQFKLWMRAMETVAKPPARAEPPPPPPPPPRGQASQQHGDHGGGISRDIISRVYKLDTDKRTVSLGVLPKTDAKRDADALVLILYGFATLLKEEAVLGTRLNAAAKASGVQRDRVDRVIEAHSDKLTTAGAKKGKTYGLNNPGKRYAEELLSKILNE